jgi:hypothetical protein
MTDPININPLSENEKYNARLKFLENDRLPIISLMKDVSEYILPRKGLYTADGEKPHEKVASRYQKILNSTSTRASRLLASGMQGGLTSPSRPWFRIGTEDPSLYNFEEVAIWCQLVEDIMYSVFNGSNFYSAIHTVYEDEGGFGQGVLLEEEDPLTVIRFTVCPPGEYCLASNERGFVDTLYRRFWMPACNIVRKFGRDRVSDDVKRAYETKGTYYKLFEIIHVIEPRSDRKPNKIDYTNMPYRSVYYEHKKTDRLLRDSGFKELPFMAPRWSFQNPEVYGDCPSFDALGVTKMLQASEKISIKAMDKGVDPPLRIPSKWAGKRANLLPGGHNYVDSNDPKDSIGRLYDIIFDVAQVEKKIERFEMLIERLYFMDLFTLITDRPEMTATEVLERKEEKLTLLGPTIENQIHELLEPILERTFSIMARRGMIPPAPEELRNQKLKVEYISLLAQAQKMIGISGMEAYLEKMERLAAVDPGSLDKTDTDAFLEEYAERVALSPRITRDQELVDQMRAEKAARQKQLEDAEMLKGAAGDIKALSQADTSGKNALTDIAKEVSE